jgi:hypothetical protein
MAILTNTLAEALDAMPIIKISHFIFLSKQFGYVRDAGKH